MGADQTQRSRTPVTQDGRGGVWLEEDRFAEAGSFEHLLWLQAEAMCHRLLARVINEVQATDHEERARLSLDFPEVVAAFELEDWYKAPVGAEAWKRDGERLVEGASHVLPGWCERGVKLGASTCQACPGAECPWKAALRAHEDLKKKGT